jgi:hypothetical protein
MVQPRRDCIMPTGLPPRRSEKPSEEKPDDGAQVVIPAMIIFMLLMANIALYADRYGSPTASTAAPPAQLQSSP